MSCLYYETCNILPSSFLKQEAQPLQRNCVRHVVSQQSPGQPHFKDGGPNDIGGSTSGVISSSHTSFSSWSLSFFLPFISLFFCWPPRRKDPQILVQGVWECCKEKVSLVATTLVFLVGPKCVSEPNGATVQHIMRD